MRWKAANAFGLLRGNLVISSASWEQPIALSGSETGKCPGGARKFMRGVAAWKQATTVLSSEYREVAERHAGGVQATMVATAQLSPCKTPKPHEGQDQLCALGLPCERVIRKDPVAFSLLTPSGRTPFS